jgi:hypothetical protein
VATAATAVAPPATYAPWWYDRRFQVPAALVGATLLATVAFTVLHLALKEKPPVDPKRDDRGWKFPELGYFLCPQGAGLPPTNKQISKGSVIVVALGSPTGYPIELAWGKVADEDTKDPNRIQVVLVGQASETGQVALKTDRHGFRIGQRLWLTRDCVWDVLQWLNDPNARLLCGAELLTFDGPDPDTTPDDYMFAWPPAPVSALVGRKVELLLVSKAGRGTAWQVPLTAEIVATSETKHIATVRVVAIGRDELADAPDTGHHVRAGDMFDITWDCVLKYL